MWTPSHSIPWNILIWAFLSTTVINLPRIVKWPLTFFHFCGSKHATVRQRALLTRLRQNGRPCAMMLMLKIFRTFWGGNCSLVTSLGSARSSGWSPGGTCEVSFPQTVGIFLRAPDDEKRGIGQCRSIAEPPFYCIISRNPRWRSGACCRFFLSQTYRHSPRWTSSPESPPCPSITLLNILGVWHQCCATARRSSCFQALRGGSPKPVSPPSDRRCAICSHDPPQWNASQQSSNVVHVSVELHRCGQTQTPFVGPYSFDKVHFVPSELCGDRWQGVWRCQLPCVSEAVEDISGVDNAATRYAWPVCFKPGSTWQTDQQSRLVLGNTASMKQQQRWGNTLGGAKDVAWMPHKTNKLCTFMQSSKWANNHTQTERPCLNTWLSPSTVLTSTIVWGGLQCRCICQSRLRAPTHEPDSRLSGAIYMDELWRGNTVLQSHMWNTHTQ